MRGYLGNLWSAICGRRPRRDEGDDALQKRLEEERAKYDALRAMYDRLVERNAAMCGQIPSYQTLVDNLRRRLEDKDEMVGRIRNDYRRQVEHYEKRMADYCATIAGLQERNARLQETGGGAGKRARKAGARAGKKQA